MPKNTAKNMPSSGGTISEEELSLFQKSQLRSAKAYLNAMKEMMADPDTKPFDVEQSQRFSKGAKLKACFENCCMLFLHPENTDFPFKRARYVEGYIWNQDPPQLTIHHAWIELDGKIIDPTRIVLAKKSKAVLNWHYKAKRRITGRTLMAAIADGKIPLLDE